MNIPLLKKGGRNKVVLWDMATECNYVRIAHAEKMGFSYKMERLVIQTVGGEVPEGVCPVYTCKIMGCHTWGDYKRTVLSANTGTTGWPIPSEQWSGESDSQTEARKPAGIQWWAPILTMEVTYGSGWTTLGYIEDPGQTQDQCSQLWCSPVVLPNDLTLMREAV